MKIDDLYYSQRKEKQGGPKFEISSNFWVAFLTYFERLKREEYFCKSFPSYCPGELVSGTNDSAITERVKEEFGRIYWPLEEDRLPGGNEYVFNVIEFIYRYLAKPTKWQNCEYCEYSHPKEYDVSQGRYEYTITVNQMFSRFNHPFKLNKGKIEHLTSEILDTRIFSTDINTNDSHLKRLIERALDNFYERTGKKKLDGLRNLVDAFERLKTLENSDKKKSIDIIMKKISYTSDIIPCFDSHFGKMTELANKYTIRHHEKDKITLEDESLIDFLFYSYYNLIRLILEKYKLLNE